VFISASSRPHGSKAIPPGASGRLCGPSARSWTYVAARQSLRELGLSLRALGRLDEAQRHWLHALTIFEELQAAGTDQVSRPARSIRQIRATRRAERLLRRVSFSCWPGAIGCVCVWWSGSGMVRGGAGGAGLREVHGGCIAVDGRCTGLLSRWGA